MNAESWKLILAFGGLFLTTITGPVLWALITEGRRFKAELESMESRLKIEISNARTDMASMESRLKIEISSVRTDMANMETRLNERITTRLVHK
jgi:ribosomal protein L29